MFVWPVCFGIGFFKFTNQFYLHFGCFDVHLREMVSVFVYSWLPDYQTTNIHYTCPFDNANSIGGKGDIGLAKIRDEGMSYPCDPTPTHTNHLSCSSKPLIYRPILTHVISLCLLIDGGFKSFQNFQVILFLISVLKLF